MTKDEALKLALEALEYLMTNKTIHYTYRDKAEEAITAIKQARALDKMAENARELGLDYEPVGLIDRLTNPEQHYEFTDPKKANAVLMSLCQEAADALAAPTVQPMAHIVGEIDHTGKVWKPVQPAPVQPVATVQCINGVTIGYLDVMQPVGTKLYTTPPAAPELVAAMAQILGDRLAKEQAVYLSMETAKSFVKSMLAAAPEKWSTP
jgi:hypothetical protein